MKKGIFIAASGTVIGGIVIAYLSQIYEFFLKIIHFFLDAIFWIWTVLSSTYSMPGWMILIVGVFFVLGIAKILFSIFSDTNEPEFVSYIEDRMHGVIWRWSWHNNCIMNLSCYCPACDAQLVFGYMLGSTNIVCERCFADPSKKSLHPPGRIVTTTKGDVDYLRGAVEREILRRIRTNEMKVKDN